MLRRGGARGKDGWVWWPAGIGPCDHDHLVPQSDQPLRELVDVELDPAEVRIEEIRDERDAKTLSVVGHRDAW